MQIISKLSITAALTSAALAQIVTVGQPTGSFVPGTFGQTFSDGGYVSAGVANPFAGAGAGVGGYGGGYGSGYGSSYGGGYGGYGAGGYGGLNGGLNVGVGLGGGYPGAGFQGGYGGGYGSSYGGGYGGFQGGAFQGPAPGPIGAGVGLGVGANVGSSGGLGPPPPPIYTAGTSVNNGVSGGNISPPQVQVGAVTHNGGFRNHKRQIVTVGQPTASFVPGTFGASFSDGGYVSAGVPDYAQLAALQSGYYGVPAAYGSAYPYVKLRQ